MPDSIESPPALCPRCQYDQSGVITSWTESCPLRGTCSECGLAFSWGELLSGKLTPPPWWSVERDSSKWVLKIPLHWFAMFFPKRTWTGVRMEHPIQLKRLLVLATISLAAAHFASSSVIAVMRWINWGSQYSLSAYAADLAWPYSGLLYDLFNTDCYGDSSILFGLFLTFLFLFSPLVLLVLPQTRSRAKVHNDHLIRLGCYTAGLTPVFSAAGSWSAVLLEQSGPLVACVIAIIFLATWWYRATTKYVRLHLAIVVVASIVVVSAVGAFAAFVWFHKAMGNL